MQLHYKGVTIRDAVPGDGQLLARWWNDGSVMAHAGFPNGLGTTAEKIAADLAKDSDSTRRRLILMYDSLPIGEMAYHKVDSQTVGIDIKICEVAYQEKGIGRIALSLLICHLFYSGYTKIVLDTNLNNTRAQHIYEKLGFQKLRVNKNSWRNQLGEWESSVDYALTKDKFHNFAVSSP